jgi:hypothetical protein
MAAEDILRPKWDPVRGNTWQSGRLTAVSSNNAPYEIGYTDTTDPLENPTKASRGTTDSLNGHIQTLSLSMDQELGGRQTCLFPTSFFVVTLCTCSETYRTLGGTNTTRPRADTADGDTYLTVGRR